MSSICRCCCVSNPRWYDYENSKVSADTNNYIARCAERAIEVKKTGSKDELFKGLTSLIVLKDHWAAKTLDLGSARELMQKEIPFRVSECSYMLGCCGTCTRWCNKRCVQDIMQKLYMKAINIYVGNVEYRDAPLESRIAYDALMDPSGDYATLLSVINELFHTRTYSENRREDWNTEYAKYQYAPQTEFTVDSRGRKKAKVNPETGEVLMLRWPNSGLCPFCLPRTIYHKVQKTSNTKRLSTNEILRRAEDFQKRL